MNPGYIVIGVSGTFIILYYLRKFYLKHVAWQCSDVLLDGKTVVVTGSNTGIGKEVALDFASRGAKVIFACRDLVKARVAANEVKKCTENWKVSCMALDLANFESIRRFAEELKCKEDKIDILVNNAGVFFLPEARTVDGYETIFQVNYLGPFLLTLLCVDLLKKSASGQIINVSSHGHRLCHKIDFDDINLHNSYGKFKAYAQSKAALILFTRTLSQKLKESNITVNTVNPGNVETEIYRHFPLLNNPILRTLQWPTRKLIFKNSKEGAQTVIQCAVEPKFKHLSGKYFNNFKEEESSELTRNVEIGEKLWKLSLQLVGLNDQYVCNNANKENVN